MHKVAIIDLGTNTFNLLIATKSNANFEVNHSEKSGVALGMGGINENIIAEDAFERGIQTVLRFKSICDSLEVDQIIAIGTSALRDAKNKALFLSKIKQLTGLEIEIISGQREAELIYKGVSWSYHFDEPTVIMDIGGGSTEFIIADKSGILEIKSFNIGVSRIFQEFKLKDPLSLFEIFEIKKWLDFKTDSYFHNKKCTTLIGASGSFETFYEMIHKSHFVETFKALQFPMNDLNSIIDWVIFSKKEDREQHPHIIPIRKNMAPIAAIKTQWIIEHLGIQNTFVTPCSMKEGILFELFQEKK